MNIVVMLAGSSKDFTKNGQKYPKLLTEINGRTMIEVVLEGLKALTNHENNIIFMIDKLENDRYYLGDIIKLVLPESHIMTIGGGTSGAALTSLLAVEHIDDEMPLALINGDQLIDYDENDCIEYFKQHNADAGVIVFNSYHPRWSYVKINNDGLVSEAAEKRPISNNATAGFYYYKKASDYIKCAKRMILKGGDVEGVFYICPVFNEMILDYKKILTYQMDSKKYHSFMSPEKVKEFESHENFNTTNCIKVNEN
jgi:NDP-sugar pyrophosphorylase family protein